MIFTFNPVALSTPIQSTVAEQQAGSKSPASFGRVESTNVSVKAAAGLSNTTNGMKAAPNERVEIGSQTKMMTATVVLQLSAEGKIDLDDLASKYLPVDMLSGIAQADTATVRQLLEMRSGIANYTDVLAADGTPQFVKVLLEQPDRIFSTEDSLDLARDQPAMGAAGEFNYSNTNYLILGKIIEAVTGESLAQTMENRIFKPAGMNNTALYGAVPPEDIVRGYLTGADGKLIDTTQAKWDKFAEGGVVSTTADMTKFIRALLVEGKLLAPEQLAAMKDGKVIQDSPELKFSFGLGLAVFELPGQGVFYGFNGGTLGFVSSTFLSESTGLIASTAFNYADAALDTDAFALELLTKAKALSAFKPIATFDAASDVVRVQAVDAADLWVNSTKTLQASSNGATLKLPLETASVTTTNVKFSNGSLLIVGDNKIGTAGDQKANTIDIAKNFSAALNKDNQLLGLGGDDVLRGGRGDDRIRGGDGADVIYGRDGNDGIHGGRGADKLFGDDSADRFIFSSVTESGKGSSQRDVVADFECGVDKIVLHAIDADALINGNQAFSFIGKKAFSGDSGEVHIVSSGLSRIVEGDIDGDRKADFQIVIRGQLSLSADDFVL